MSKPEALEADVPEYILHRVNRHSRSIIKQPWTKLSPAMQTAIRESAVLARNAEGEPTKARLRLPLDATADALFRRGLVWKRTIADTHGGGVVVTWHLMPVAILMLREFGTR